MKTLHKHTIIELDTPVDTPSRADVEAGAVETLARAFGINTLTLLAIPGKDFPPAFTYTVTANGPDATRRVTGGLVFKNGIDNPPLIEFSCPGAWSPNELNWQMELFSAVIALLKQNKFIIRLSISFEAPE